MTAGSQPRIGHLCTNSLRWCGRLVGFRAERSPSERASMMRKVVRAGAVPVAKHAMRARVQGGVARAVAARSQLAHRAAPCIACKDRELHRHAFCKNTPKYRPINSVEWILLKCIFQLPKSNGDHTLG
eukprot:668691-Pleurochrysis_carterae.AAC.4